MENVQSGFDEFQETANHHNVRSMRRPHKSIPESLQNMRAEGVDQWYVSVASLSARHYDPADAWNIVARIERVPFAVKEHLHPGAEVHWIDDRDADVAEMTVDVARWDVEAAATGNRQMREVAAHTDALIECLEGRPLRPGLHIVEAYMMADEIADRLYAIPPRWGASERSHAIWLRRSVSQSDLPIRWTRQSSGSSGTGVRARQVEACRVVRCPRLWHRPTW